MPRLVVTSGGTVEKIDDVRSIRNDASGRLGSIIADKFYQAGYEVIYIHGPKAIRPKQVSKTIEISGVRDLEKAVEEVFKEKPVDYFIHSMAVSDFYVDGSYSYERIKASESLEELKAPKIGKIESSEPILVHLKPAPKIIQMIKKLQDDVVLVGFKLLAQSSDEALIAAAKKQIKDAGSDYVLANHKEEVFSKQHRALLIDKKGELVQEFQTKEAIAQGLLSQIESEKKGLS